MASRRGSRKRSSSASKRVMGSAMSIIPKAKSLFYNRTYLYFISLFSILYFLGKAVNKEYLTVIVFMITSMFTYETYTKNMAIVLTVSCITSILLNSLYITTSSVYRQEGMTTKDAVVTDDDEPVEIQPPTKVKKPEKKNTESLTPLHPATFNKKKRGGDFDVDLASTLEQSYGMLNNLLDNDGISNLTDETKRLITEQKKLFESMNSMAPLIGQAKEMLGMFNTNDFKNMDNLAQSTMKKLNDKNSAI